ncbi:calmodulin-like protein 5 [Cyclospora cayetanensis]|uniref:Calmodulin-like protein 5 n=1 Tax=Cyclospora cayetanensis TaxID=88456 RepID=A0A6P6RUP8_9EIME|nr:calmodulin-like protein 5 [Cyclospora cayetanensis]
MSGTSSCGSHNSLTLTELPTQVELEALKRAFNALDADGDGRLSSHDILSTLCRLRHKITRASLANQEVEVMLWEVDEDLDGHISWSEFLTLYQRGTGDATGLEPRGLFHVVQFLMYDRDLKGEIGVEQTLQILFVRFGRELLDEEIQAIFGEEDRKHEGPEKRVTLTEYLERVKDRTREEGYYIPKDEKKKLDVTTYVYDFAMTQKHSSPCTVVRKPEKNHGVYASSRLNRLKFILYSMSIS